MNTLQQLTSIVTKQKKRVGRGYGSGVGGHTATRGQKGQKSRGRGKVPLWFEGGQLPLIKRLPMWRGKGRLKSVRKAEELTLDQISHAKTMPVTIASLKEEGLINYKIKVVKVVNTGTLKKKIDLSGVEATAGARKIIEDMGGKIE